MDGKSPIQHAESEPNDADVLLGFVASRDVPCPACGYNLRMLNQPICPECGLALKLTVGSDEPFKRAWAILLTLTAMIAGVGLLVLLITAVEGPPQYYEPEVALLYFGSIAAVPLPILLFLTRRWFCLLPKGAQYAAVGLSAFWIFIMAIAMISLIN